MRDCAERRRALCLGGLNPPLADCAIGGCACSPGRAGGGGCPGLDVLAAASRLPCTTHPCPSPRPQVKKQFADVLSVLAMTMSEDDGKRESLEYKLTGSGGAVGAWGHEYVRHLAAEVGEEYNARLAAADAVADKLRAAAKEGGASDGGDAMETSEAPLRAAEDLLPLVTGEMIPFFIQNNAEAEAIDLLMEVGQLECLTPHVDATNCGRICMYLVQVSQYVPEPEDSQVRPNTAFSRSISMYTTHHAPVDSHRYYHSTSVHDAQVRPHTSSLAFSLSLSLALSLRLDFSTSKTKRLQAAHTSKHVRCAFEVSESILNTLSAGVAAKSCCLPPLGFVVAVARSQQVTRRSHV